MSKDSSLRDARNVEQVVDQAAEVHHLARDDFARPRNVARIGRLHAQGLGGGADRRQRVAQFVRKHGEEGVLAAVLVLERGQPLARHPLAVPQAAHEFRDALRGFPHTGVGVVEFAKREAPGGNLFAR